MPRSLTVFIEEGFEKGDRVAVMLPNILQNPVAILGVLRAGLVVVNVNPLYSSRELCHQLCDSEAKAIIILGNFCDKLADIFQKHKLIMLSKLMLATFWA